MPVLPSLAEDEQREGDLLNVNADTAAAAVASALRAEKLVFLTDTAGILRDKDEPNSLIPSLKPDECRKLIEDRVIDSGMIPKVEACLESLTAGVGKVHIIDGRLRHSLLLEIFTDRGIGTEIVRHFSVAPRPSEWVSPVTRRHTHGLRDGGRAWTHSRRVAPRKQRKAGPYRAMSGDRGRA